MELVDESPAVVFLIDKFNFQSHNDGKSFLDKEEISKLLYSGSIRMSVLKINQSLSILSSQTKR